MRNELRSSEEFDEALWEEIQVSREFELDLCVLCVRVPDTLDAETTRRLLDGTRAADLAASKSACELAVVLPNTVPGDAQKVARRLLAAVSEAEVGESCYRAGDTPETLLDRARESLKRYGP